MHLLFITPYPPGEAPSQRFRFEQYFDILQKEGHTFHQAPFFSLKAWKGLYHGSATKKALATLKGYFHRVGLLFTLHRYDRVFIHREATPLGPPWVEWLIAKVWRKKIIYDFDDAIWLSDPDESGSLLSRLKWKSKVCAICRWSYRVSVGNDYLAQYARKYASQVIINPTTVDTQKEHNTLQHQNPSRLSIGWTGSHSTLQYLKPLVPILQQLEREYPIDITIIANRNPNLPLTNLRFVPWSKASEIKDLLRFHIGLMPLTNDPWSQGKCGFKAIQYLALGIPAVVSPVGVNGEICPANQTGLWATEPEEWHLALKRLLEDKELRSAYGINGRAHIEKYYSKQSNQTNFLLLFR